MKELGILFSNIFNISITASCLAAVVFLLRLILKRTPKWINCFLWVLVGLRLLMPFSIESALSLIPGTQAIPTQSIYNAENAYPSESPYYIYTADSGVPLVDAVVDLTMLQDTNTSALQSNLSLVGCFWIIGVAAMLIYTLVSYRKIKKNISEAALMRENIYLCDNISTPFILGIFKPCVYLPSALNEGDAELVIAHEKAHLERHDHWWKPLGFVLLSVHWFNPILWVAYSLFCRDIELACDEKVIKDRSTFTKKAYLNALINCSSERKMISACPLAFGETGVKKRIKSVLNYKKPTFWVIVIAVILCIITAVCFLTDPQESSEIRLTDELLYSFVDSEILKRSDAEHIKEENCKSFISTKTVFEKEEEGNVVLSMIVNCGCYSLSEGVLNECYSNSFPVVLTVKRDESGCELIDYWQADTGADYDESIREKIPFRYWYAVLGDNNYEEVAERTKASALEYFELYESMESKYIRVKTVCIDGSIQQQIHEPVYSFYKVEKGTDYALEGSYKVSMSVVEINDYNIVIALNGQLVNANAAAGSEERFFTQFDLYENESFEANAPIDGGGISYTFDLVDSENMDVTDSASDSAVTVPGSVPDNTLAVKSFKATVLEVFDRYIVVEPHENEVERKSHSKIAVITNVEEGIFVPTFSEGDVVTIEYDGLIAECYPPQITTVYSIYPENEELHTVPTTEAQKVNEDFEATVLEASEGHIFVEPFESEWERSSGDRIYVFTGNIPQGELPELKAGDVVQIVYDGLIATTDPPQINSASAIYLQEKKTWVSYKMEEIVVNTVHYAGAGLFSENSTGSTSETFNAAEGETYLLPGSYGVSFTVDTVAEDYIIIVFDKYMREGIRLTRKVKIEVAERVELSTPTLSESSEYSFEFRIAFADALV